MSIPMPMVSVDYDMLDHCLAMYEHEMKRFMECDKMRGCMLSYTAGRHYELAQHFLANAVGLASR